MHRISSVGISSVGDLNNYTGRQTCISFDLFDTLIRRRLLEVNEVHDTVSAYALAQTGRFRSGNPFDLTRLRYKMPSSASSRSSLSWSCQSGSGRRRDRTANRLNRERNRGSGRPADRSLRAARMPG